jgi:hypothetical protein
MAQGVEVGGGATRCHRNVHTNAGLCGDLVSVGTVGTSYSTTGTALGTACPCTACIEVHTDYVTCMSAPATCISL